MNKVILIGRLTKDPEIKYTKTNNTTVTTFTLAVNRKFTKQGEEQQTDFINVTAYSKIAEFISNYFQKGQQIAIVGRLQLRNWDDDNGQKHYVTEVIAEETYFAESKKSQYADSSIMNGNVSNSSTVENNNSYDDDLPF